MHKKHKQITKLELHARNKHRGRYDFTQLIESFPQIAEYVAPNKFGDLSIDFADPKAVKILNSALLKHFYSIEFWDIPENYLCPPIPGRADYIHHIADLLAAFNDGRIPKGQNIRFLDIGAGANFVYPIIGIKEYGWKFVGTDIDKVSIANANKIIARNAHMLGAAECRLQADSKKIFDGIIRPDEFFAAAICNPPFHGSLAEARSSTLKKLSNLNKKKVEITKRNFGGQNREIWYEGGELGFIQTMIRESVDFQDSCFWFTTLVSKQSNLRSINTALKKAEVFDQKTIPVGHGNKISRIIAWTFQDNSKQEIWHKRFSEG